MPVLASTDDHITPRSAVHYRPASDGKKTGEHPIVTNANNETAGTPSDTPHARDRDGGFSSLQSKMNEDWQNELRARC